MTALGGFTYYVTDEQIDAYRSVPIERRLQWIEETARATYDLASPEVRERWARLRRGERIDGDEA